MCSMKISEASQKFMKMKDTLCKELLVYFKDSTDVGNGYTH